MVRKRRLVVAAAVLAGTLAMTACGGGGAGGGEVVNDPNAIKIGFMGDLTGESSGIVIPGHNGAKLAVAEYNKTNPPRKIELKDYDSQGSADQAVPLAQQALNTDKIVALIGPAFSGESRGVVPILEEAKIPSVSQSATAANLATRGWKYWHRVVANDDFQGPAIADFLARVTNAKSAFVISDDQEYSVGIAEAAAKELTKKGVAVQTDRFAKDLSDYSSTVAKVKAANPQAIFYGGYYAQAGRLLKQLRDNGVTAPFASGDGSTDKGIIDGAGAQAAEGAILGCPCAIPGVGNTEGALKAFYDKYTAEYKIDPAIYAAEGYDAATAFINAIKAGKTTSDEINTYLSTESFQGVAKPIRFQASGEVAGTDIFVHEVKAGKLTLLGKTTDAKLR
ncbi:MAG TPA: branched-chain amino acid ABC transporter substrate-binding protein [Pseudonocardia sp.]